MGLIKKIQQKKENQIKALIIKHGLILLGFNLALSLALFFTLASLMLLESLLGLAGLLLPFLPLVAIFIFASASAIIWYRMGSVLASEFKKAKLLAAAAAVLISVILLVLILLFLALIFYGLGRLPLALGAAFLGAFFLTLLAIIFELPIVILGVATAK